MSAFDGQFERKLKPLKPTDNTASVGVIVVHGASDQILVEQTGEKLSLDRLADVFTHAHESIVISDGFPHIFARLHAHFKDDERWQYRAIVQEMEGDTRVSTTLSFFGFKRTSHKQRRRGRYFYPVAVDTFIRDLSQFDGADEAQQMLSFGIKLRDFCAEMKIRPKTTGAGIAAQLLRHPQFYPEPRRHTPTFINDVARSHLPGNHYALMRAPGDNSVVKAATYIDQKSAHHYAARTTPLPSANSILGRGSRSDRPWLYPGERAYDEARKHHGLFKLRIRFPHLAENEQRFVQPIFWENMGKTITTHIWSNELAYMERWGARVHYLIAGYSTKETDDGLPRYAEWAERQPAWLKQTLLTPYGILATRARRSRIIHANGRGEQVEVPIGPHLVEGYAGQIRDSTNPVTFVIQRGLIESYVRQLSLELAHQLDTDGGEVLSIYGDGVFVRARPGDQLQLPAPWREKREVHNLTFDGPHRLRSDELTRLPGTARFFRDYAPSA